MFLPFAKSFAFLTEGHRLRPRGSSSILQKNYDRQGFVLERQWRKKKKQHPAKKSFPQKVVSTAAPHVCSRFFLLAFVGTIVGTTSYPWVLPHFAIGICVIFAAVSGLTLLHQKQGATVT